MDGRPSSAKLIALAPAVPVPVPGVTADFVGSSIRPIPTVGLYRPAFLSVRSLAPLLCCATAGALAAAIGPRHLAVCGGSPEGKAASQRARQRYTTCTYWACLLAASGLHRSIPSSEESRPSPNDNLLGLTTSPSHSMLLHSQPHAILTTDSKPVASLACKDSSPPVVQHQPAAPPRPTSRRGGGSPNTCDGRPRRASSAHLRKSPSKKKKKKKKLVCFIRAVSLVLPAQVASPRCSPIVDRPPMGRVGAIDDQAQNNNRKKKKKKQTTTVWLLPLPLPFAPPPRRPRKGSGQAMAPLQPPSRAHASGAQARRRPTVQDRAADLRKVGAPGRVGYIGAQVAVHPPPCSCFARRLDSASAPLPRPPSPCSPAHAVR
ncbi:hypothetical protein CDD83_9357 [Cordyceps sp. RAO-2017]|nr:hypothetical protein CDD83_9357 [Cordyceps sp. RAO-2017]